MPSDIQNQKEKKYVLEKLENNGFILQDIPNEFKNDREVVFTAIQHCGESLKHVPNKLKTNMDIILTAARGCGERANVLREEFLRWLPEQVHDNQLLNFTMGCVYFLNDIEIETEQFESIFDDMQDEPSDLMHSDECLAQQLEDIPIAENMSLLHRLWSGTKWLESNRLIERIHSFSKQDKFQILETAIYSNCLSNRILAAWKIVPYLKDVELVQKIRQIVEQGTELNDRIIEFLTFANCPSAEYLFNSLPFDKGSSESMLVYAEICFQYSHLLTVFHHRMILENEAFRKFAIGLYESMKLEIMRSEIKPELALEIVEEYFISLCEEQEEIAAESIPDKDTRVLYLKNKMEQICSELEVKESLKDKFFKLLGAKEPEQWKCFHLVHSIGRYYSSNRTQYLKQDALDILRINPKLEKAYKYIQDELDYLFE
jgi:hypothetical protein